VPYPAGLQHSHPQGLTVDRADQLAAIAAGVQALAHGASVEFGDGTGGVRNSMTEFHGGILFIVEAGVGSHLAVIATEDADVGLIGHNMDLRVLLSCSVSTAPPRSGAADNPAS